MLATLIVVLAVVGILSFVSLVHEGGHYLAARLMGIPVFRFKLGMGPHLRLKIGFTEYCFGIIPIGGYVFTPGHRMEYWLEQLGCKDTFYVDNPEFEAVAKNPTYWNANGSLFKEALLYFAGPAANLVMVAGIWLGGEQAKPAPEAPNPLIGTLKAVNRNVDNTLYELAGKTPVDPSQKVPPLHMVIAGIFAASILFGVSNLLPVTNSDGWGILTCLVLAATWGSSGSRTVQNRIATEDGMKQYGWLFYVAFYSFIFFTVLLGMM